MKRFNTLQELREALRPYNHNFNIMKCEKMTKWYYADENYQPMFYYLTMEELVANEEVVDDLLKGVEKELANDNFNDLFRGEFKGLLQDTLLMFKEKERIDG